MIKFVTRGLERIFTAYPDVFRKAENNGEFLVVDPSYSNESKAIELTGDSTTILLPSKVGVKYYVKGITIICEGNQGEVRLNGVRGVVETLLLPNYVSVQARASASSALNIKLDANTPITVVLTGRGASRTFVGVSYIEVLDE